MATKTRAERKLLEVRRAALVKARAVRAANIAARKAAENAPAPEAPAQVSNKRGPGRPKGSVSNSIPNLEALKAKLNATGDGNRAAPAYGKHASAVSMALRSLKRKGSISPRYEALVREARKAIG